MVINIYKQILVYNILKINLKKKPFESHLYQVIYCSQINKKCHI